MLSPPARPRIHRTTRYTPSLPFPMRPLSPTTTPITLTTIVCRQLLRSRCRYRTARSSSPIRSVRSHQFRVSSLAPFGVVSFLARQFKFTERTEAILRRLLLSPSVLQLSLNAASRPHALIPQLFPGFDFYVWSSLQSSISVALLFWIISSKAAATKKVCLLRMIHLYTPAGVLATNYSP